MVPTGSRLHCISPLHTLGQRRALLTYHSMWATSLPFGYSSSQASPLPCLAFPPKPQGAVTSRTILGAAEWSRRRLPSPRRLFRDRAQQCRRRPLRPAQSAICATPHKRPTTATSLVLVASRLPGTPSATSMSGASYVWRLLSLAPLIVAPARALPPPRALRHPRLALSPRPADRVTSP